MQTLAQTPAPVATKPVTCFACHAVFHLPAAAMAILPTCPACSRSHAEAEARKLVADYVALRDGTGVFGLLTKSERREQLAQFAPDTDPDPKCPAGRRALCEMLSDDELVDLGACVGDEIANRLGSVDPDPIERQRIEADPQTIDTIEAVGWHRAA